MHITDYSNASRTMLFNINTLEWDEDILEQLHIPKCMFPEVKPSSCIYGEADASFLGGKIPNCRGGGRPTGSFVWTDLFQCRRSKNTYDRDVCLLMNTGGKTSVFREWAGDNYRMGIGWESELCTGRFYFCGRCRNTVAA